MMNNYKLLLLIGLVIQVYSQRTTKQNSRSSATNTAGKTQRYSSAVGEGRTLGLIGPLLSLGLSRPSRVGGTQASSGTLSDPVNGGYNGYGGYGGYGSQYQNYNPYAGYPTYGQYGGYPGGGYPGGGYPGGGYPGVANGAGYRPPIAYPQYNGFTSPYPQQNYGGLSSVSPQGATPNAGQSSLGLSGSTNPNTAQQAQLAAVLGQILGSSLRPLLAGAGGQSYGTPAAAFGSNGIGAGGGNLLASLLNLFG